MSDNTQPVIGSRNHPQLEDLDVLQTYLVDDPVALVDDSVAQSAGQHSGPARLIRVSARSNRAKVKVRRA